MPGYIYTCDFVYDMDWSIQKKVTFYAKLFQLSSGQHEHAMLAPKATLRGANDTCIGT